MFSFVVNREGPPIDSYAEQLENELADHLQELRLEEQHACTTRDRIDVVTAPVTAMPDEIPGTNLEIRR